MMQTQMFQVYCQYLGCMIDHACNYDASANEDDGSCEGFAGCMDINYEYDANATCSDGSCASLIVYGCTDASFIEFNANANFDDESCLTLIVPGCTDITAFNYDFSANQDDGSCIAVVWVVWMLPHLTMMHQLMLMITLVLL